MWLFDRVLPSSLNLGWILISFISFDLLSGQAEGIGLQCNLSIYSLLWTGVTLLFAPHTHTHTHTQKYLDNQKKEWVDRRGSGTFLGSLEGISVSVCCSSIHLFCFSIPILSSRQSCEKCLRCLQIWSKHHACMYAPVMDLHCLTRYNELLVSS